MARWVGFFLSRVDLLSAVMLPFNFTSHPLQHPWHGMEWRHLHAYSDAMSHGDDLRPLDRLAGEAVRGYHRRSRHRHRHRLS